jgi:hypothetical protein
MDFKVYIIAKLKKYLTYDILVNLFFSEQAQYLNLAKNENLIYCRFALTSLTIS